AEMTSAFEERYRAAYGDAARITSSPVQVSRIGVDAVGEIEKPDLVKVPAGGASPESAAERPARDIYWVEVDAWQPAAVWDGMMLKSGNVVAGPALIELPATCVAVPPEATASVDSYGNFIIRLNALAA